MALVACPECRNQISDKARTCPRCGFPARERFTLHLVSRSVCAAGAGVAWLARLFTHRRRTFYALAKCLGIALIGLFLFQFVVPFGAICMGIYAVALFRLVAVVWKRTVTPYKHAQQATSSNAEGLEPVIDDDTCYMPLDIRHASSGGVSGDDNRPTAAVASPSNRNNGENTKAAAERPFAFLRRAFILFMVFAIVSVLLRPVLERHLFAATGKRAVHLPQKVTMEQPGKHMNRTSLASNATVQIAAQNYPAGWLYVTNMTGLTFWYPSDLMEEQSVGDQAIGNETAQTVLGESGLLPGGKTLRLQQKGLTERKGKALETYLRISVVESESAGGSSFFLDRLNNVTDSDLRAFDDMIMQELSKAFSKSVGVGKDWRLVAAPASRISALGGRQVLETKFKRQFGDRPIVTQTEYRVVIGVKRMVVIQDGRFRRESDFSIITITTQLRDEERERWGEAVEQVLGSVRFL